MCDSMSVYPTGYPAYDSAPFEEAFRLKKVGDPVAV